MSKEISTIVSGAGMYLSLITALDKAVKRNGGNEKDIHRLTTKDGEETLEQIAKVIVEKGIQNSLIIDCDAFPLAEGDWKIESHFKNGKIVFDPKAIKLYLSNRQKDGSYIRGTHILKELQSFKDETILNANALDWFLRPENQRYIPEYWEGKNVFFWGTIYRYCDGSLCVRCLYSFLGYWRSEHRSINDLKWSGVDPAIILVNK
jgi:hypothetical protein